MSKYSPIQNNNLPDAEEFRPPSNIVIIITVLLLIVCALFLCTNTDNDAQNIWESVWIVICWAIAICAVGITVSYFLHRRERLQTLAKSASIDDIHQALKTKHILQVNNVVEPTEGINGIIESGGGDSINCIVWEPEGNRFATGSTDKNICIYNITAWEMMVIEGHTDSINSLAWSPDGKTLASAAQDKTICLWDGGTGTMWQKLTTHTKSVHTIAWSPDGQWLASASEDHTMRIWDVEKGEETKTFAQQKNTLALAWSPDGRFLATSDGKNILLRHTQTWESSILSKHSERVTSLAWSPDSTLLLSGAADKTILVWDIPTGQALRTLEGHVQAIHALSFIYDGKLLVSRSRDGVLQFRETTHWQLLITANYEEGNFWNGAGFAFNPTATLLAMPVVGGHALRIWEVEPEAILTTQPAESTELFTRIKAFLLAQKQTQIQLVSLQDLYSSYQQTQTPAEQLEDQLLEFKTCIGRLEAVGLIQRLSFGDLILLQPELLSSYTSELINTVKDEPEGLGYISIERIYKGDFKIPDEDRIQDPVREHLFLISLTEDLLKRELVLEEVQFLIFPSAATRIDPAIPEINQRTVFFTFEGPVQNIYATLSIRLARSKIFTKKDLWKNAITYNASAGGVCGLALKILDEGVGELALFFDQDVSEQTLYHFEEYIESYLQNKSLPDSVQRRRLYTCPNCANEIPDQAIQAVIKQGENTISCYKCTENIVLDDQKERLKNLPSPTVKQMNKDADKQRDQQVGLTRTQGKKDANDFDVFLYYNKADQEQVQQIGTQLKEHGILPWLNIWELQPGLPWQHLLEEQIHQIKSAAIFVGASDIDPWQMQELEDFLRAFVKRRCPVIPVLLPTASTQPVLPTFLESMTWVDFRLNEPDPMEYLLWGITGERSDD